jgi:hypothetical protein
MPHIAEAMQKQCRAGQSKLERIIDYPTTLTSTTSVEGKASDMELRYMAASSSLHLCISR